MKNFFKPCSCNQVKKPDDNKDKPPFVLKKAQYIVLLSVGLLAWYFVYSHLARISSFITYTLLGIKTGTHLGSSLEFFFYDTPKVIMLLILVIYFVGILRAFVTPERTRRLLAGKSKFLGNVLAALLGIITPFCSCSAVPLFIGFVTAGVPLGVTFSFLISAPLVNEIALVLLYGLLGWKIAALYLITGLIIAIFAGVIIGWLHMEKYVENWVLELKMNESTVDQSKAGKINCGELHIFAWQAVKDIIGRVWIYMVIGIAVGAGIHGYVPQDFMAAIMGKNTWWSVPLAVVIGVPMYSNAAGIIPVVEALLGKGAALGTVLAFMMSVIALSLPEMIILRKVLKMRLIYTFVFVVTIGILIVGYLFNWLI
jgi:uncharacterized protein